MTLDRKMSWIVLLASLFFVVIYLLLKIDRVISQMNVNRVANEKAFEDVRSSQQRERINCDNVQVFAMSDEQCAQICNSTNEQGVFVERRGVCVNSRLLSHGQAPEEKVHCTAKYGLVAYGAGDSQFGTIKFICLSVDPGVQSDLHENKNLACQGAQDFTVDYRVGFPTVDSCKCPKDSTLTFLPNTKTIRPLGVCVSNDSLKFYKFQNLIYGQ